MIQQLTIDGDWETSRKNVKKTVYQVLDDNHALRSSKQKRLVVRMCMKKWGMGFPVTEIDFFNLIEESPTIERYIRDYIVEKGGR